MDPTTIDLGAGPGSCLQCEGSLYTGPDGTLACLYCGLPVDLSAPLADRTGAAVPVVDRIYPDNARPAEPEVQPLATAVLPPSEPAPKLTIPPQPPHAGKRRY